MPRPASDLSEFLTKLDGVDLGSSPSLATKLTDELVLMVSRRLGKRNPLRRNISSTDIAQDVLLQLQTNRGDFRGKTWNEFIAYLKRFVDSRINDTARRETAQKRDTGRVKPLSAAGGLVAQGETPSQILAAEEERQRERLEVARWAEELPPSERAVIKLMLDNCEAKEIATRLGISETAARQRLSRGLTAIRRRREAQHA